MKTNQEIQTEARQLMALGSQFQNEQRIANASALAVAPPRVLASLPLNQAMPTRERHVEAAFVGGALVFRLMERETDVPGADGIQREAEGTLLASSPSAYDVLSTGYELAEEERLAAALERYAERSEDCDDPADGETVVEVEKILETNLLPHADRLRTKAEVVEFLEGRLEPSVLIARNIERQGAREGYCEYLVERRELKLTIGEP
ncbi:MAG: hypothetical protein IPP19_14370 [Verrucomicrobia bacterium]|nr:hypothetical protein [Verrucomicrobiota bacterium]